jgi:hypothetical protein
VWTWRTDPVRGRCAVVDLDGVLADPGHRLHLVTGPGRKDWPGFFAACGADPLLAEGAALVASFAESVAVVVLTARPTSTHGTTVDWLARHGLRWDLLGMRPEGDYRPAPLVKRDALEAMGSIGLEPVLAVDDDPRNVAMFRAAGVPGLLVSPLGAPGLS